MLVTDLRTHAGSRKLPVVTDRRNVLFDLLVHGQDIAVPLGFDLPVPPAAAAESATRVWMMGWPFWARRRLRGLHLSATDVDWSMGSGAEVRGSIRALLLLLTGRTAAAAPLLSGPDLAASPIRGLTGHHFHAAYLRLQVEVGRRHRPGRPGDICPGHPHCRQ